MAGIYRDINVRQVDGGFILSVNERPSDPMNPPEGFRANNREIVVSSEAALAKKLGEIFEKN